MVDKKILKKPSAKIKGISARKVIEKLGTEQGVLVRDIQNPYADPVQDTRSLFFKESFNAERKKSFGGFL